MANHRLRHSLVAAELSVADLAGVTGVDSKSVQRWLTQDRRPHARTRARVCQVLNVDETYLWPELLSDGNAVGASQSEHVQVWPSRSLIPGDVWQALLSQTTSHLDVLVYAAMHLVEAHDLPGHVRRISAGGGQVRLLLGDSDSPVVAQRGVEEGLPQVPGRCTSSLDYVRSLLDLPGVELRVHGTPLYASLYRFDESMLVNTHLYGAPAKDNPTHHLRRVPGGLMFARHLEAFTRVWDLGRTI